MRTIRFPIERTTEFPRQGDRREFVLLATEGHSPARQKRIILEARACGFLSDEDATAFIDACGLREA